MKIYQSAALAGLFAATIFGTVVAIPANAADAGAKKPAAKAAALKCPVTGETIASVKDAAGHSTYKGKTYYFCCPSCKPAFDKTPQKYIKAASAK